MTIWYVSTTGSASASGGLTTPWDLATALTGGNPSTAVQAGDTIWVREGTYNRTNSQWSCTLQGGLGTGVDNADQKIIVRNYLGDQPALAERAIIQQTNATIVVTTGALTVNGVNASAATTLSIAKAAGTNQPYYGGEQISIATGPAAGTYVLRVVGAGGTLASLTAAGNTTVTISPGLRGATDGTEAVTLLRSPTDGDNLRVEGASYVWFWGLEFTGVQSLRSAQGTGSNYGAASFGGSGNTGIKFIHCLVRDNLGGFYMDPNTGRYELYGNVCYNNGASDLPYGNGDGHNMYLKHTGPSLATVEGNVCFNDAGTSVQWYSSSGTNKDDTFEFLNNVIFNAGVCNTIAGLGGVDAKALQLGGEAETMHDVNVSNNWFFTPNNKGDRVIQLGAQTQATLGVNIAVNNNYSYGAGSGFGCLYLKGQLAAGGTVTAHGNTFVVQTTDGGSWHGFGAQLADVNPPPSGWVVYANTYYRSVGSGEAAGTTKPFRTVTNSFATLAQWKTDTGFTTDVENQTLPTVTRVVTIPTTRYEAARGFVLYYNYASLTNIPFSPSDFGIVTGDTFVVHDVRNIWAGLGTQSGTPVLGPTVYTGGTVNLPNTEIATPAMSGAQWGLDKETTPPSTAPTFNCFLVRRTASVQAGPLATSPPVPVRQAATPLSTAPSPRSSSPSYGSDRGSAGGVTTGGSGRDR